MSHESQDNNANAELVERFTTKLESEPNLDFLQALFKELPELEMYLVGGMVRDTIIKHPTSKDFDFIARNIPIEELIKTLQNLGSVNLVGKNFGVLKFRPKVYTLDEEIDIALPRKEFSEGTGGYKDFDTQSDHNMSVEEDLSRRDLTINAIAWDIKNKLFIDPHNGQQDLEDGIIRTVGKPEDRFQEDYSRMLRAIRFSCRFGYSIEDSTWDAIVSLTPHLNDTRPTNEGKEERIVPLETIGKEVSKMFKADPSKALELLLESGALQEIVPEIADLEGTEAFERIKVQLQQLNTKEFRQEFPRLHIKPAFIVGTMLSNLDESLLNKPKKKKGKSTIDVVARRLRFSTRETQLMNSIINDKKSALNHDKATIANDEKIFVSTYGNELQMFLYLDSFKADGTSDFSDYDKVLARIKALKNLQDETGKLPDHLLDGKEIMSAIQLTRGGKIVGNLKHALREEQLQQNISTPEQAIKWLEANWHSFQ